jgi:long-chain acyl-CoA synthetase
METTRLFDISEFQYKNRFLEVAIASKVNGEWVTYSSKDLFEFSQKIALGLLAEGFKPGDRIANISNNRPEWNFTDQGMLQMGGIHVPIYPTISDDDYKFILKDAGVTGVFVSNQDLFNRLLPIKNEINPEIKIFTFDRIEGATHWSHLIDRSTETELSKLEDIKKGISAKDLATLIYTSGTTGNPKGVMLSHDNIMHDMLSSIERVPVSYNAKALSFLPLCHSFERMITYIYMYQGISIYYAESMDTIGDNLKEIKPQVFSCVPRLLEKVYGKIMDKALALKGIKKGLFFWALNLGLEFDFNQKGSAWYNVQLKLANKLIFSKWREALGGEVKCIVSGAAALQPRLAKIFWAAQIPVLEGYGLSETSPVIAVNDLPGRRVEVGAVGPPISNIEVKIATDGEILTRGRHVMMGYYNRPDLTAEAIDEDGWLHTGDIGEFTALGNIKITDRKKEMFKTSGGKYIAPQVLENKFKESPFIEQIMVIGENEKFPAALISPNFEALKVYAKNHDLSTQPDELIHQKPIQDLIKSQIEKFNQGFGDWEKIKKWELCQHSWSLETGELTPTLKLKRKIIANKYQDLIEKIYRG